MLIKDLQLGKLQTNCYIVSDEKTLDCVVIDPGDESNAILNYAEDLGLKIRYIFITHGHFDHTMAVNPLREATGATVYICKKDASLTPSAEHHKFFVEPGSRTEFYGEGDVIELGSLRFEIMETPGHSPGAVCIRCENVLFCGDTLFRDSCGRTDLQGGSMRTLLRSLKRLYDLPGDYEVYPGHADSTTLERERRFNYYMQYAIENSSED